VDCYHHVTWTKGHGVLQAIPTVFVRQTKSLFVFVNYVAVRATWYGAERTSTGNVELHPLLFYFNGNMRFS